MASRTWKLLILLLCTLLLSKVTFTVAQDVSEEEDVEPIHLDETEEYEEQEEGSAHSDVKTVVYFPDHPDKKLPVGEMVTALIGFTNIGESYFNITFIGAFFHSPFDHSYFIQNFSRIPVGVVIDGGRQVTLEYRFVPDKSLEPVEFLLTGYVEYNDTQTDRVFRTGWVNVTVQLVEKSADFSLGNIFSYVMLFGGFGVLGYVGFTVSTATSGTKARKKKAPVEQGTAPRHTTDADWGSIYKPAQNSGKKSRQNKTLQQPK